MAESPPGEQPRSLPSPDTVVTPDISNAPTRKRSSSESGQNSDSEEPATKKIRVKEESPELLESKEVVEAVVDLAPGFNDERWQLLQRSAALVLDHVGFTSASREALEGLCSEIDAYASNFLSYVRESMLSARRSIALPMDFEYALRRAGLNERLLRPHLKPPVPASRTVLHLVLDDIPEPTTPIATVKLGEELSGAADKLLKPYIPKQFPAFPSKHTYKSTDVIPARERDPRKIREQATEAARHGEEALRRLVKVGKVGDKEVRKASEKSIKHRHKHELWESAMADFATLNDKPNASARTVEAEEQSILIDADKRYRRKPVTRSRN